MNKGNAIRKIALSEEKDLRTLVENRTAYTMEDCELNVFETYSASELVPLTFSDLVVTSMLLGKKVMHLFDNPGFDYLPGETVIVPPNETMRIDFPEAEVQNPTQCIALAIDAYRIRKTLDDLNERYPKMGSGQIWKLSYNDYHFRNDKELALHISKMITIGTGSERNKDVLADLALQELIVRLVQHQQLNMAVSARQHPSDSLLYNVVQYIKENISKAFTIAELCKIACMSKVTLYRNFKREFGISPVEFIIHERIRLAKRLLASRNVSISDVCYEIGFMDTNYFHRQFKKTEGVTPRQFVQISSTSPKS